MTAGPEAEPKTPRGGKVWTEEEREVAAARMREWHRERKAQAEAEPEPEPEPEPVKVTPADEGEVEELQQEFAAEIERLKAEAAEAQAKAEALDPTKDVSGQLFNNTADVRRFFPESHLVDIALDEWAAENKDLTRRGRNPLPEPKGQDLEKRVERAAAELLADRTAHVQQRGFLLRVVKMVKPNGSLIEVPLEGQINSFRIGGAERAFAPYRAKGYKVADPYLCQSQGCWLEAVIGNDGQFAFDGYCGVDHRSRTELSDPSSDRNIRPLYG
jgi:hypothetical protein